MKDLQIQVTFGPDVVSAEASAMLRSLEPNNSQEYDGTKVWRNTQGDYYIIVDSELKMPDWLEGEPKGYRLISFRGEGDQKAFRYTLEASEPEGVGSFELSVHSPSITAYGAFLLGIEVLEKLVDGEKESEQISYAAFDLASRASKALQEEIATGRLLLNLLPDDLLAPVLKILEARNDELLRQVRRYVTGFPDPRHP